MTGSLHGPGNFLGFISDEVLRQVLREVLSGRRAGAVTALTCDL